MQVKCAAQRLHTDAPGSAVSSVLRDIEGRGCRKKSLNGVMAPALPREGVGLSQQARDPWLGRQLPTLTGTWSFTSAGN